jgi:glycosyltransferase involved in cell wall biosynthesis
VVNTPWDWRALRGVPARRRVFDMADDWSRLMPGRERRFQRYLTEIAAEADEIIVVNPELSAHFPGRVPMVIRNGVSEYVLKAGPNPEIQPRTILYLGTFSERFNAPLMEATLQLMPNWRLELIGPCLYGGLGSAPAPELRQLLRLDGQVRWHGPLPRDEALPWVDRASVAIIPNRREHSAGQDSMKFYDYAARGRPMVSTRWFSEAAIERPPHLLLADTAQEMVEAITRGAEQSAVEREDSRAWAASRTWTHRWPLWSAAVFGNA